MAWTMALCENAALTIPELDTFAVTYSWCKISLVPVLEICIDISVFYDNHLVLIKTGMSYFNVIKL